MRRWLAACLLVWGCGGSSGGGVPAGACTFTATIDGTGWVASPGSASNEGSVLDVFGSDSGEDLVIALGEPATGTFGTATSGLVELADNRRQRRVVDRVERPRQRDDHGHRADDQPRHGLVRGDAGDRRHR